MKTNVLYFAVALFVAFLVITLLLLLSKRSSTGEYFSENNLNLEQYRYQLYQHLSIKTLKDLCNYDEKVPYCFQAPKNMGQFRKSIKIVAKDAIMNAIKNKNYLYLILIILKINSMELSFLNYEDCVYFYSNAYGTGITTGILNNPKDDIRKVILIRVSDLFKIFENDCFHLNTEEEINNKIKELGYKGEDASNYKIFYNNIVKELFEDKNFKENMINNQTNDMPLELFAKYGTAIYLSNYLFDQTNDQCEKL